MDLKRNRHTLLLVFAAVALSGAALYLSEGLYPKWWATWLAALPVLWISPRLRWPAAFTAVFAAGIIGRLSMWGYLKNLRFPLWLQLASLITPAIALSLGVLLFRDFSRRGRFWLAALAFPSLMVAYEYLLSLSSGTFGATAYTQLKNLPIVQLGALTGLWGIGFVVLLFPAMVAAILLSPAKRRLSRVLALVLVFAGVFGYGEFRLLTQSPAPPAVVVGLAASDLPKNMFPQDDRNVIRVMRGYADQVRLLSMRGAQIVVLPEMIALVRDTVSSQVNDLFEQTARLAKVQIVLGVLHVTSHAAFNEARMYLPSGTLAAVYCKRHLVPVLEGRTTPIKDISLQHEPAGTIGLAICRDMDYLDPASDYGKAGVGLLLVPAWDFGVDRLWHGHMAIMRGIEDGFTIARVAKNGLMTVSDSRGRVLSEMRTTAREPFTTMLATVPVRHVGTLYQSWGDWFAWLDIVVVALLLILAAARRQKDARAVPQIDSKNDVASASAMAAPSGTA